MKIFCIYGNSITERSGGKSTHRRCPWIIHTYDFKSIQCFELSPMCLLCFCLATFCRSSYESRVIGVWRFWKFTKFFENFAKNRKPCRSQRVKLFCSRIFLVPVIDFLVRHIKTSRKVPISQTCKTWKHI